MHPAPLFVLSEAPLSRHHVDMFSEVSSRSHDLMDACLSATHGLEALLGAVARGDAIDMDDAIRFVRWISARGAKAVGELAVVLAQTDVMLCEALTYQERRPARRKRKASSKAKTGLGMTPPPDTADARRSTARAA